jgi:hypothetical protein
MVPEELNKYMEFCKTQKTFTEEVKGKNVRAY